MMKRTDLRSLSWRVVARVGHWLVTRATERLHEDTSHTEDPLADVHADDPLADVLQRAIGGLTGKLRVSDAYLICGLEPGKVSRDQIERLGKAMRALGWERKRCYHEGTREYVYVRGTEAEREAELSVEYDPQPRTARVDRSTGRKPLPGDRPDSVTAYLEALVWDDKPRIDRWLIDLAGADDTEYVRRASRAFLIAAVRRARKPGCRFEQLLVLDGPQGCGKSQALQLLAVEGAWFGDELPLGNARTLMEATAGKWIVEAGELRKLGPSDAAALKTCLSQTHDQARLAYQRPVTRTPRQFVIVGTTSAAEYLADPTSNRRIWPVRIRQFDLKRLAEIRDQLWAEAAAAEFAGEAVDIALATPNAPSA